MYVIGNLSRLLFYSSFYLKKSLSSIWTNSALAIAYAPFDLFSIFFRNSRSHSPLSASQHRVCMDLSPSVLKESHIIKPALNGG